jgi:DNA-binding transcriptional LysR family regulator
VFVHVGERGSFTVGAAAARVPQSVASRRIAALEEHFGGRLLDRSARRAALTPFGRDMLPSAKRLVQLAEAMEYDAEQAKLRPFSLGVPETCSTRHLAMLAAAARGQGTVLDFRSAGPAERAGLLRSGQVRAALAAVPPADADWTVPLGVAAAAAPAGPGARPPGPESRPPGLERRPPGLEDQPAGPESRPLYLDNVRPSRTRPALARIWIQPEDDVPHVRDRLEQAGRAAALLPAQIAVAPSLVAAVAETMRAGGLLLCSAVQGDDLGLQWRPLAGAPVARGYSLTAATAGEAERLRAALGDHLARALSGPADAQEDACAPSG